MVTIRNFLNGPCGPYETHLILTKENLVTRCEAFPVSVMNINISYWPKCQYLLFNVMPMPSPTIGIYDIIVTISSTHLNQSAAFHLIIRIIFCLLYIKVTQATLRETYMWYYLQDYSFKLEFTHCSIPHNCKPKSRIHIPT